MLKRLGKNSNHIFWIGIDSVKFILSASLVQAQGFSAFFQGTKISYAKTKNHEIFLFAVGYGGTALRVDVASVKLLARTWYITTTI